MLDWVAANPIGSPFVMSLVTCIVVIFMGPYTLFAIGTGYALNIAYDTIFKVLAVGTAAVFIGAWIGAIIAFTIGRFLCR